MIEVKEGLLGAYLDNELDAETRAEIDRAIQADPALKARLDALRRANDFVRRTGMSGKRGRKFSSQRSKVLAGIGVGVLAACAFGAAFATAWSGRNGGEALYATGPLRVALETAPTRFPGSEKGEIAITLTFLSDAGLPCREFHDGGPTPVSGIACRDDRGWRKIGLVYDSGVQPEGFTTASGATVLDAIHLDLGAGARLTPSAENQLRRAGWR
jgi:hypothetical protein